MAARAPQTEEDLVVSLIRVVGAAAVTGVLAAGFAIAFRVAVARGLDALLGTDDILAGFGALPVLARLILPVIGGFIAGLIGIVAVQGSGHALADVMEAVTLGRGAISLRLTFAKSLASYAALVSGASLGREGSILQTGAALGEHVGRRMRLPARERRALLAAGTAAGFAAAYNTPIAAVVFVIEVITGVIELETLLPVIVATTAATAATRAVIGGVPLYGKRSFALASPAELAAHASVGVLAGLLGPVFLALLLEG
jgi:CIC family chloride channel protein